MPARLTQEEFIRKAIITHGNKYLYDKVIYKNSTTNVTIYCKIHQEYFFQTPSSHIYQKAGCLACGNVKRLTQQEFINKVNKIHGENKFNFSLTEFTTIIKHIKVKCNDCGHIIERQPRLFIENKMGCPICTKSHLPKKTSTELFLKKLLLKKPELLKKYKFNEFIYKGYAVKSIVTCLTHGNFKITPNSLWYNGCPECGKLSKRKPSINVDHVNKFLIENTNLRIIKETFTKIADKAVFVCSDCNNEFSSRVSAILYSNIRCPYCKTSKGERLILDYLKLRKINFEFQYRFRNSNVKNSPFDFYLLDHNLIIEYQGIIHYFPFKYLGGYEKLLSRKKSDKKKRRYALSHKINYLEIPYFSKNPIKLIEDKIKEIEILQNRTINTNQLQLAI